MFLEHDSLIFPSDLTGDSLRICIEPSQNCPAEGQGSWDIYSPMSIPDYSWWCSAVGQTSPVAREHHMAEKHCSLLVSWESVGW